MEEQISEFSLFPNERVPILPGGCKQKLFLLQKCITLYYSFYLLTAQLLVKFNRGPTEKE